MPRSPRITSPVLRNAADLARDNPDSFERPDEAALKSIVVGDNIKVARVGERFRVKITKVKYPILEGRVANPVLAKSFNFGDIIRFHSDNVYEIQPPEAKT